MGFVKAKSVTLGSLEVNVSEDGLSLVGKCHVVDRSVMEIDFILGDYFLRQANVLFTKFEHSEDEHV